MIITQPQIVSEVFRSRVFFIRNQKVMLDEDIAELQGMKTSTFNREMKRQQHLFVSDSRFRLTSGEFNTVKLHLGTSDVHGGRRYPPYVYTERGVEIVLSVLRKKHSTQVGVAINRILSSLREIQKSTTELARKFEELAKTDVLPLTIARDVLPGVIHLERRGFR